MDDGSSDGSSAIARDYAARYPAKVRYLDHADHRNLGQSASRNAAMRMAAGTYIAYVDADDVAPRQASPTDKHSVRPAAGRTCLRCEPVLVQLVGRARWQRSRHSGRHEAGSGAPPARAVARPLPAGLGCRAGPFGSAGTALAGRGRRRLDESYRGPLQLYEDQAFLAKVYVTAPIFVASDCFDQYRQHPGLVRGANRAQQSVPPRPTLFS